jgi:hypothetical protein
MTVRSLTSICGAALVALALTVAGCGGSDDLKGAPDVKGLSLPTAETVLHKHGYAPSVSDDALFGVVIKSHFTVCSEHTPDGHLVPIDVSKDC